MKTSLIKQLLFTVMLVMTVIPMGGAVFFVDRAIEKSLNLGFNAQVVRALEDASRNAKTLGHMDSQHSATYREQFERVENLREVYGSAELIKAGVQRSLIIYVLVGLGAALALSLAFAMLLSRKISDSFEMNFATLSRQRDRIRYLEEISSWQEFAKILAHEIKNPLTPIEVLITSLRRAYREKSAEQFDEQLSSTEELVMGEVNQLKNIVERFSSFARLPRVELAAADVGATVKRHLDAIAPMFTSARIRVFDPPQPMMARIDATLFRQAMTNIVRNGVEANPDRDVEFTVSISSLAADINISIENNGAPVNGAIASRIFDPYISTKAGDDNMGLGLAIVRKILIEHGGEVTYACRAGHPVFTMSLPRIPS